MTPPPMNSMLEKESKSDALKKRNDRSRKIVENVPPTIPGTSGQISLGEESGFGGRGWGVRGGYKENTCRSGSVDNFSS